MKHCEGMGTYMQKKTDKWKETPFTCISAHECTLDDVHTCANMHTQAHAHPYAYKLVLVPSIYTL